MYIAEISTVSEAEWTVVLAEYRAAEQSLQDAYTRAVAAMAPFTHGDGWPMMRDLLRDDAPAWAAALALLLRESDDKISYPNLHYVRSSHTNTPAVTVRKATASRRNWIKKIDRAIAAGGAMA